MARGRPRITQKVMERLMELALEDFSRPGYELHNLLIEELKGLNVLIPAESTCQHDAKVFREQAARKIDEKPWSLATMDEAGIPWQAAGFLLEAFDELRHRQKEGEIFWGWSAHPLDDFYKGSLEEVVEALSSGREPERISVKPLAPRASLGTVLTNRQAKWLWRIHLILPSWTLPKRLPELCQRADEYAHLELLADYLPENFDTSNLDGGLIVQLRDIKDRETSGKKQGADEEKRERGKKT